jgi:glucokinase
MKPWGMHLLAIEIGGTKLQICAGTPEGEIVDRYRLDVNRGAGGAGIRTQIAETMPRLLERWKPQAIGVGYGGPVDWRTGRIQCSHHVEGWNDFPLGDWLREQTGLPAFVENDANTGALGEALRGAGQGCSPVFWINSGTGVGGGLVVDGRIYHGAIPGEVEIGHLRLDRAGTTVEGKCAGPAVDRRVREVVVGQPSSILSRLVAGQLQGGEARYLAAALAEGCPAADEIVTEVAEDLAFGLSHAVQLLHPEIIVFGGGLSLVGEPLRERIAAALPRWVMEAFAPGPRVALAALREDAVPVGALLLAAAGMQH